MVGSSTEENRSSLVRRLKMGIVLVVGLSMGLVALNGGAPLEFITLAVAAGLAVGVLLVRIVFPGTGEAEGLRRRRGRR